MTTEATKRDLIDTLLDSWPTDDNIAKANVYALLEVADAIEQLGAAVEKLGWAVRDPQP